MLMEKVAHVRLRFLPLTETFIYGEITGIKAFETFVFCAQRLNRGLFPARNVKCISGLNPVSYAINGLFLKFGWPSPYFSRIIEDEGIRILHAHYGPTGVRMLSLKKKHNIPLITSFRGIDASLFPSKNPRMYDELFREGELFLVRSLDMRGDLMSLGCPQEKIIVHHSGIDIEKFGYIARKKGEKVRILSVSRLSKKKGLKYLLEAFSLLKKKHSKIRLHIVGEGPQKPFLRKMIKELGLEESVKLLGGLTQDRVIKEMMDADIFALASHETDDGDKEGVPNVLMEAMATGLPIVATVHAGVPELVTEGVSGYLVPERDAQALASTIERLIEGQKLWESMGKAGRDMVEREFNIRVQSKRIESIYSKLIGDSSCAE